jgi:DNA topoisomerase-1
LRELGEDPVSKVKMVIKEGRFGPYVTDGETNASLRKGDAVETVTLQRAVELLAERRAAGPAKPRRRAASAARAGTGRSAGTRRTGGGARRTGTSSPSRP